MTNVDELWNKRDIAAHLKLSVDRADRVAISHPTFPQRIAKLGDNRINPLWYAEEVKRWVRRQRKEDKAA